MDTPAEDIIDAEIQQLKELKRMARNPRMVEFMRALVTRSANDSGSTTPGSNAPTTPRENAAPKLRVSGKRTAPNRLYDAVTGAVKTIKPHFSNSDLAKYMEDQGFHFIAKNHRLAVIQPMEKLVEAGVIRISRNGIGNKPNRYEYVAEKVANEPNVSDLAEHAKSGHRQAS